MVREATMQDKPLLDSLAAVFSRFGYEGANIGRLCEAVDLQRASLYYRFPGGKDEMVEAIITRQSERFEAILSPAFEAGDPAERARQVATGMAGYYDNGHGSCVIIALSLSDDDGRSQVGECLLGLADGLAQIATDAGMTKKQARVAALDAVAAIEGALIVSSTTGELGPFERALSELPERLTITKK